MHNKIEIKEKKNAKRKLKSIIENLTSAFYNNIISHWPLFCTVTIIIAKGGTKYVPLFGFCSAVFYYFFLYLETFSRYTTCTSPTIVVSMKCVLTFIYLFFNFFFPVLFYSFVTKTAMVTTAIATATITKEARRIILINGFYLKYGPTTQVHSGSENTFSLAHTILYTFTLFVSFRF